MKAFVVLFCVFFATMIGYSQGLTFNFSQMNNPDPDLGHVTSVLLVGNRALSGSKAGPFYYDGVSWSIVSSQESGRIVGFDKGGGEICAFSSSTALYSWDDSVKSWGLASIYPYGTYWIWLPFIFSENDLYFVANNIMEYGTIFHWDGTEITALSSDICCSYSAIHVKDQNNIFVITHKNANYDSRLMRYNNCTKAFSGLYTFPDDRGVPHIIRSNDNNIFFVLTFGGDIYRWDNSLSQMDKVFHYDTTTEGFGGNMIVINNDNIVTCGNGGIRHVKVSTGQHTVVFPTASTYYMGGASYNGSGRAIFTGSDGLILEMQVIGSVPDESIASALNLYPNPANNLVTLEFPVFGVNEKTVELYSSTGQLVKREHFQSFKTELDISALPSGIYLVQVKDETGKKLASKKLSVI